MTSITKMDRAAAKVLAEEVDKALGEVAERLGLNLKRGNVRFDPTTGECKFGPVFTLGGEQGADLAREKFARDLTAISTTITADHFGAEFVSMGQKFRLDGVNTRAPKFPFSGTEIATGKRYKFGKSTVERLVAL